MTSKTNSRQLPLALLALALFSFTACDKNASGTLDFSCGMKMMKGTIMVH